MNLLKALANEQNVNNKLHESTPLHVACENDNHLAVKLLLEFNCHTLYKDSKGRLPFHVACSKSLECVKEMLPFITNDVVNNCENNGNTPLHIALKNNQLDIVNFLLSNFQCNFSIKNSEGEFPMHVACKTTLHIVRGVARGVQRGQMPPLFSRKCDTCSLYYDQLIAKQITSYFSQRDLLSI